MENYELIKQVGEGSFGQVYRAKRKFDGATVAFKITRKKGRSEKELVNLREECEIQKKLHHPNIIQMLDSFETDSKIVVVTEYVEMELYEVLSKAGRLSEIRAAVITCDLVSALHYLHSKRIVHRDMKPQNVLVDQSGVSKLCDFGFATLMQDFVLKSIKGTPLYMAPELMDDQPYDEKVDLWSLGCIVYELVTGKTPFQTKNLRELVQLVRYEEIKWPDHISLTCKSFLEGLLKKDVNERLSWPDLLEHPFVKGRILIVDEEAPRSLTSPLSASQTKAKQQQIQSLASRFTSQSKKIFEKQIKKIHSQVLRRSGTSGSETSASVDVLLNNLSLRASLKSDLVAVENVTNCQTDCSIIEEENFVEQQTAPECTDDPTDADLSVSMQPAACCLEAMQQNANAAAAAAAAAVYQQWDIMLQNKRKSDAGCMSNPNNTNSNSCLSASMDDLKNMSASRISSEHERELKNIMGSRLRLPGWKPRDDAQPIENEEWAASLQSSIEEAIDGDISMLLQKNCLILFTSPLKNPGASSECIELTANLLSLPFVLESVTSDDLDQLHKVYLEVKVVPDLVYAIKLLSMDRSGTETEDSSVASRWKSDSRLSIDVLQTLECIVLLLCRLVHTKQEFLTQLCDAIYVIPDGIRVFQGLLGLEKRTPRIVSDLLAILNEILRTQNGNVELVEQIIQRYKSTDEIIDLFTKLLSHKQSKPRSRVCIFLLLLGKFSQKTLQRVWGKALRDLLENLAESREDSVQCAATEAISFLKQLPFYLQDKDAWNIIET